MSDYNRLELVYCRCTFYCERGKLKSTEEIDYMHPSNRGKVFLDGSGATPYYSTFERCPKCKRSLLIDNRPTTSISQEKWEEIMNRRVG